MTKRNCGPNRGNKEEGVKLHSAVERFAVSEKGVAVMDGRSGNRGEKALILLRLMENDVGEIGIKGETLMKIGGRGGAKGEHGEEVGGVAMADSGDVVAFIK